MSNSSTALDRTTALALRDKTDSCLQKAKAIVWLMANQDASEIINDEAMTWSGMVATDLINQALEAVGELHRQPA